MASIAPCVFIGFDRPELTQKTLPPLKGCPILYLFCDGATRKNPHKQNEYREIFNSLKKEREPLQTKIWLPEKNYGPLLGPPTAFLWMLEHEGEGTIVEEDVITTPRFHLESSEILQKYRNHSQILALSSGLPEASKILQSPYSQSNLLLVWGWATWYHKIKTIPIPHTPNYPKQPTLLESLYYRRMVNTLKKKPDYAWSPYIQLHLLKHNKKTLFPKYKTTQNIGIHPKALRSRGLPDSPPQTPPPQECANQLSLHEIPPILAPEENLLLLQAKTRISLWGEITIRLAFRTKIRHLLQSLHKK